MAALPLTAELPSLLMWVPSARVRTRVEDSYVSALADQFACLAVDMPNTTIDSMAELSTDSIGRLFTLPTVAGSLLYEPERPAFTDLVQSVLSGDGDPIERICGRTPNFEPSDVLSVSQTTPYVLAVGGKEIHDHSLAVADAIGFIDRSNEEAAGLFFASARYIAVQERGDSGSASGSWFSRPQLIGLTNPGGQSEAWLVNALLHEAIHSFLYMIEASEPWFPRGRRSEQRLTSPWTGAHLAIHSLVHACFVWWGLFHYWQGIRTVGSTAFTEAARIGFDRSGELDAALDESEGEVCAEVIETIRTMAAHFASG